MLLFVGVMFLDRLSKHVSMRQEMIPCRPRRASIRIRLTRAEHEQKKCLERGFEDVWHSVGLRSIKLLVCRQSGTEAEPKAGQPGR